jgi:hypothetical protein
VSNIAVLAPEVGAALPELAAHDAAPAAQDAFARMQAALGAAAGELRAEAARREGAPAETGLGESARVLWETATRLEQPGSSVAVDRLVHELVTDLVADALAATDPGRATTLSARAFALKALARHEPLWPGAGPRLGCPYSYESILALVRASVGYGVIETA